MHYALGKGEVESSILSRSTRKSQHLLHLSPDRRSALCASLSMNVSGTVAQNWHTPCSCAPDSRADFDLDLRTLLCTEDLRLTDEVRWHSPTYLYRYYDDAGSLLYIGITGRFLTRDEQHWARPWRWEAARADLELFPSHTLADAAERHAIEFEAPRHNKKVWPSWGKDFTTVPDKWFTDMQGGVLRGCRKLSIFFDGRDRQPFSAPRPGACAAQIGG